ncbi:hypothetical protein MRX96_006893 [Rhipicephalus microplus]
MAGLSAAELHGDRQCGMPTAAVPAWSAADHRARKGQGTATARASTFPAWSGSWRAFREGRGLAPAGQDPGQQGLSV